jgi:endo-alpha-N-acetylgalactosaminidase
MVTMENLPPERTLYWRVEAVSWGGVRPSSGTPGSFVTPRLDRPAGLVFLSELPWIKATAGAENPVRRDVNYYGQPLAINGGVQLKGLWTHAYPDATPADIVYDVSGKKFDLFKADVGLDDASGGGSVQFQVLVDGAKKAESPVLRPRCVHRFCVPIAGAGQITLRVLNGGDGHTCDHAAWGAARFLAPGVGDPLDKPEQAP